MTPLDTRGTRHAFAARSIEAAIATLLALSACTAQAQGLAPGPRSEAVTARAAQPASPSPPPPSGLSRWIDFQTGTIAFRYRYIETSTHDVTSNHVQSQVQFRARLKLDPKARVTLNTFIATGNNVIGGWNNTGMGTGDTVWDYSVKHLFVGVSPVAGVDLSFGSFAPLRGEGTEVTTLDNDSYLTGERISVRRPAQLRLDEIAFTSAYLGDINTPNLFGRSDRLFDERNFYQLYAARRLNKRLAVSADYTRYVGTPTVHAAMTASVPWGVIDVVKYEQYIRGGDRGAAGFNVYVEKAVTKAWTIGGGYATIDESFGGLNADRFNRGKRVHQLSTIKLTPELSAFVFGTAAVHTDYRLSNRYRFELGLTYNVLGGVRRAGWIR